jgi:hypothetical protein
MTSPPPSVSSCPTSRTRSAPSRPPCPGLARVDDAGENAVIVGAGSLPGTDRVRLGIDGLGASHGGARREADKPGNSHCYPSGPRVYLASPGTLEPALWSGRHPKAPMQVESSDGTRHDGAASASEVAPWCTGANSRSTRGPGRPAGFGKTHVFRSGERITIQRRLTAFLAHLFRCRPRLLLVQTWDGASRQRRGGSPGRSLMPSWAWPRFPIR